MAKTALKINYPNFDVEAVIDPELKKDLDKITHDHLTESNTARTLRNIRKNVSATIKANYNISDKEQLTKITDELLKIHGLHEDNFDFMKNFENGIKASSIVDHTIDGNANKNEKVMVGYLNEVLNPGKKLIGMDMLYRTMKDLYGRKEAKKLTGEMYGLSLGLSDSTNVLIPYCWALDASKLVTVGRDFGVLPSKPCKRVSSYISSLCETIHQMSSHLAGAIAIGTFFLDLAHICIYKERRTLNELKTDKRFRKYVENEMQQFIHSVNHLSRNGVESPFTNVSIFDSIKLKGLIGPSNYGWYFENYKAISTDNDLKDKMSDEQFQQYCIDYILELQNVFMDFFEKGDPLNGGLPYRFPVATINMSKTADLQIEDEKFLKSICKRDITRFNIFNSQGTKIASCCFQGDESIIVEDKDGTQTICSIKEFVELYLTSHGEQKIDDEVYISSMNTQHEIKKTKITGVLCKSNTSGKLINIQCGDAAIKVTPDHIVKVKDKNTGEIIELTAEELSKNYTNYLIPIIK